VIVALGKPRTRTKLPYKLSSTRISYKQDPMIAIEHMILAATALGYGTCWIGVFNENEVRRILKRILRNSIGTVNCEVVSNY